jgi:hypothetical protein
MSGGARRRGALRGRGQGQELLLSLLLLVLLAVVGCAHAAAATLELRGNGSSADCPCLSPDLRTLGSWDAARECAVAADGSSACLPSWFGARGACGFYDDEVGACSSLLAPARCGSAWCWVDPARCQRPHAASAQLPGLYWSSATCGFADSSVESVFAAIAARLQRQGLRVSFPASPGGFMHRTVTDSSGRAVQSGAIPDFVLGVLERAGVAWRVVPLSAAARAAWSNEWNACVYEVALNGTDLCLSDFWVTKDREVLTQFSSSVAVDDFYLATFSASESLAFIDMVMRIFEPFSPEVWLALFCTIATVSLVIMVIELGLFSRDSLLTAPGAYEQQRRLRVVANAALKALFIGLNSFVSFGPLFQVTRWASAAVNLVFGLFLLLTMSSYTANLASFLFSRSVKVAATDLSAALRGGAKVCYNLVLADVLAAKHPSLRVRGVPLNSVGDIMRAMDRGECQFAVVSANDYKGYMFDAVSPAHAGACNKVLVGAPETSNAIALPVRADLQHYLSYLIVGGIQSGDFMAARERALAELAPSCGSLLLDGSASGDSVLGVRSLNLADLSGVFAMTAIVCALALAVYLCQDVVLAPALARSKVGPIPRAAIEGGAAAAAGGAGSAAPDADADETRRAARRKRHSMLSDLASGLSGGADDYDGTRADIDQDLLADKVARRVLLELRKAGTGSADTPQAHAARDSVAGFGEAS